LKLYGLTPEELSAADLPSQYRFCHGNGYNLYNLSDIIALHNKKYANDSSFRIQELQKNLKKIRADIKSLEKEVKYKQAKEVEVMSQIAKLGGSTEAPKRKRKTKAKSTKGPKKQEEEEEEEEEVEVVTASSKGTKKRRTTTNENTTTTANVVRSNEQPTIEA